MDGIDATQAASGNGRPVIDLLKRLVRTNDFAHSTSMAVYMRLFFRRSARARAARVGAVCSFSGTSIEVAKVDRVIRFDVRHAIYTFDIIDNFDFFHDAVEPLREQGRQLVDYSEPRFHKVTGFDLHPIFFPSIAEPVETTFQYMAFAGLEPGAVAIDLGAYSGLTSIMFRQQCGEQGRVIAVEADAGNIEAVRRNFALYRERTGREVELLEGAIWTHNDGIRFSSEGSMGSSATDIVGNRIGAAQLVPSFTLSAMAEKFALERVDFIKCDIEGGEAKIFGDTAFFARFRPRMIVEVHQVAGRMTTGEVLEALARIDYAHRMVRQDGIDLPLLECWPN